MTDDRRRQDELLDKISDLVRKRDEALRTLHAWKVSDPTNADWIEMIEVRLRRVTTTCTRRSRPRSTSARLVAHPRCRGRSCNSDPMASTKAPLWSVAAAT